MNKFDIARGCGPAVVITLTLMLGLFGFPLVMVLARGRTVDGRRAAGHFFLSIGLVVALVGVTVGLADLSEWASNPSAPGPAARPGGFFNPNQRLATAISAVG